MRDGARWAKAIGVLAAMAVAAPGLAEGDGSCAEFARRYQRTPALGALVEVMQASQAHGTTRILVDAVGAGQKLGPGWAEANVHWERAYALLLPGVDRLIGAAGAHERKRQQATMAARLRPETCSRLLAILGTPEGDAAFRAEAARQLAAVYAGFQRQFPLPPRLGEVRSRAERGLQDEQRAPTAAQRKRYDAARRELGKYDAELQEATRDPLMDVDEPPPDVRAGARKLMEEHRAALDAIVKDFKAGS
jgi:hypothetical protein